MADAKVLPFTERIAIFGMLVADVGDFGYRASGVLAPKIACSVSFAAYNAELTVWDTPDKTGATLVVRVQRAEGGRDRKLFGSEVRRLESALLTKVNNSRMIDPELKRILAEATKKRPP